MGSNQTNEQHLICEWRVMEVCIVVLETVFQASKILQLLQCGMSIFALAKGR